MPESNRPACALTGASGFVGNCLKARLIESGWNVVPWGRSAAGQGGVHFSLGEPFDPQKLGALDGLVHCAYDFRPHTWDEICRINVEGSRILLNAAAQACVKRIVLISTISAFAGCRSMYGKAKLQIEDIARQVGACVIRPGLVYGAQPGGMFGKLTATVTASLIVPYVAGGRQLQYLVHEHDLAKVVNAALEGRIDPTAGPVTVAHPQGIRLRELLGLLARKTGKRKIFVPLPWPAVWGLLKGLELLGVPTAFRSDSLVSLVYQDPHPALADPGRTGVACRRFEP